jgi:hypothetical protein
MLPANVGTSVCERRTHGLCVNGYGVMAGCTDECQVASTSDFGALKMGFEYVVSGTVIDVETAKAVTGLEVDLIIPNRKRYADWTDAEGHFRVVAPSDVQPTQGRVERVERDFGELRSSSREAFAVRDGKIAIVMSPNAEFWAAHPTLNAVKIPALDLADKSPMN